MKYTDYLDTAQITAVPTPLVPRVLIVEDDELLCERLTQLIKAAGFEVRTAPDGERGLAALRDNPAHIVIADVQMPGMDGLSLCQRIRNEGFERYVYVVLLTAQDDEQDILAGLEAGADDYLSKRVSTAQLVARLRIAARIVALEHSLRSVIEEKSRLATIDPLTGASNRRYFTRHLRQEITRAQRFDGGLALLMLDIDHFKRINDRYGHAAGDEVLKEFATRLGACLPRECDWYARVGGEEFAIVLPETSHDGAAMVAQRLRQHIAQTAFPTMSAAIPVTVSVGGCVLCGPVSDIQQTAKEMLEKADQALYASKNRGRNRVTLVDCREVAPQPATAAPDTTQD